MSHNNDDGTCTCVLYTCFFKTNQKNHRAVTTKKSLKLNTLPSSDVSTDLSNPLINENHRPDCPYYQAQSLLTSKSLSKSIESHPVTSGVYPDVLTLTSTNNNETIENSRPKNGNLNNERQKQQVEANAECNCYYRDDIVDSPDDNQQEDEEKSEYHQKDKTNSCSRLIRVRKSISNFVASQLFHNIIFAAIIINTMLMAIEYHGQPQSLTTILEISNIFFLILFTIEMLLKIIAGGLFNYLKSPLNVLDGSIVIISLIELYGTGNSGLSVLRTIRLLRILKLVRFMPTLRRQLVS